MDSRINPSYRQQQQAVNIIKRQKTAAQQSVANAVAFQNKIAARHEDRVTTGDIYKEIQARIDKAMDLAANQQSDSRQLKAELQKLYLEMEARQLRIRYVMDMDLNKLMVQLVERGSGEVRYQYPPAREVHLEKLAKYVPGIFLNQINISL